MAAYNQFLSEFVKTQDEREFSLGDTLDIKTSIALVIITFLATQSAEFMKHPLSPLWQLIQHIAIPFIVVAGLLALIELIPRNYKLRTVSDEFVKWAEETRKFYADQGEADPESKAIERINDMELQKLRNRFRVNMLLNEDKSKLMSGSFYCIFVAVCCNLATLTALAFK